MATVSYTATPLQTHKDRCHVISWLNLSSSDVGQAIEMSGRGDRSVQFTGTFGSISLQGSNDGSNWVTLTDPSGSALTATSLMLKQVMECVRYMRPICNSGAGLNCILFMRL